MWNPLHLLFDAVLFYLLVPGVVVSLPPGASFKMQAAVHGLVFAVVLKLAWHYVLKKL